MRMKCEKGCKSEFQDAFYGIGIRAHTLGKDSNGKFTIPRCTVCGGNRLLQRMKAYAANWTPIHGGNR